ncbi:MAG: phosphatidylinositol kinase, partial [bacterium]
LRRLALFDLIANNTDRKGGHALRDPGGRLAGIDHGLTFHVEDKVRTVLWGWSGEPLAAEERETLERFRNGPAADEASLAEAAPGLARLSRAEVISVLDRLDHLLAEGAFPVPYGGWPALPWPAM